MTPYRFQGPIMNIAIVGGGKLCTEILDRAFFDIEQDETTTPILAVADPDPASEGRARARELGLLTFDDYHQLYDRRYSIHLIIVLTPDGNVLADIINTRPERIRILSYPVFKIFWQLVSRTESRLRSQTTALETIFNGIQDFILVIRPDMSIEEANDAILTKLGYTREEVIGKKCHDLFERSDEPCSHDNFFCPLLKVVKDQRHVRTQRHRAKADGELYYFEVDVYPIWEKDGKIGKFVHISRDITQRKREEEEITRRLEKMVEERTRQLKETHEQLLHQDKMASLGKLSASVVHEINNPIAGILNLTKLMKRVLAEEDGLSPSDMDKFRNYLDLIETETRRTSRIVSNLLAFSRQSKIEFGRVNVNQLIERTLFLNSNLLKLSKVTVERHFEKGLPNIEASEDQLQQVFMNLTSNAAEAMDKKGGRLFVTTRYLPGDNRVLISFRDTGPGIVEHNVGRLFEPFFTTKKKGKGVGLGLSVAYGIVQEHGGVIRADSAPGEGATFTVKLPVEHGPAGPERTE